MYISQNRGNYKGFGFGGKWEVGVLVKEVLIVCVWVMLKVMEASTLYIYVHQMAVNGDGMF
jgi:hypothetical protein